MQRLGPVLQIRTSDIGYGYEEDDTSTYEAAGGAG
jgi:hypothetical protein